MGELLDWVVGVSMGYPDCASAMLGNTQGKRKPDRQCRVARVQHLHLFWPGVMAPFSLALFEEGAIKAKKEGEAVDAPSQKMKT